MENIQDYFEERITRSINWDGLLLKVGIGVAFFLFLFLDRHDYYLIFEETGLHIIFSVMMYSLIPIIIMTCLIDYETIINHSGIFREVTIFSLNSGVRTKSEISGAFFLGIGSISGSSEEVDYYVFYKEGRFGLIKDKLEAKDVQVIQTEEVEPSYKEVWVNDNIYKVLFVPVDTIKKKITID